MDIVDECAEVITLIRLDEHRLVTATEEMPQNFVFHIETPRVGILEPLHAVYEVIPLSESKETNAGVIF